MDGMFLNSSSPKNKIIGLRRAVVKEIKDPDGLNKVKVTLIDETLDLPYANMIASFATKDSGAVFIPQVDDEVIVGFLDGKINDPIILGTVYNETTKPPLQIDDKNEIMLLQFPGGLKIEIDNKKDKQKINITTKKGHKVSIDDDAESAEISEKSGKTSFKVDFKGGTIELKADKKISLSAGQDSLILEGNKGLSLKSSAGKFQAEVNEVGMKANTNINIEANAKVVAKGSASAEFSSTGQTVLKGSITQIN